MTTPASPSRSITSSTAARCTQANSQPRSAAFDAFVFTTGIGEHAPAIRARIGERLAWLGAELDPATNDAGTPRISTAASRVALFVIPTDEELMIARHTLALIRSAL